MRDSYTSPSVCSLCIVRTSTPRRAAAPPCASRSLCAGASSGLQQILRERPLEAAQLLGVEVLRVFRLDLSRWCAAYYRFGYDCPALTRCLGQPVVNEARHVPARSLVRIGDEP